MAAEQFTNDAQTLLDAAGAPAGSPSITVLGNAGFPTTPQFRIRVDNELMLVTGVAGLTWAVDRGIEQSFDVSHGGGAVVRQVLTAGALGALSALTADQPAHAVLAGPATGNTAAPPGFRALTANDIPVLANYQPVNANLSALANTTQTGYGLGLLSLANATDAVAAILPDQTGNANTVLATDGNTVAWQVAPPYPLSVGNGGTGVATLTGNQILLGNGTGTVKSIANGNATQTIGFTGPGNSPQAMDFPGVTFGSRFLTALFNLTAANGVYQDVADGSGNVSVTLPTAGTYLVFAFVRSYIQMVTGTGAAVVRLYNQTTGTAITSSESILGAMPPSVAENSGGHGLLSIVTITTATVIRLQASRNFGTSYSISAINPTNTNLQFVKVSP